MKAALGFGADQIRSLVSMATDTSLRVKMGKRRPHVFSTVLIGFFSYLEVMTTYIRACLSSKFDRIRLRSTKLAALERLKKIP